jgi:hypothetical protein
LKLNKEREYAYLNLAEAVEGVEVGGEFTDNGQVNKAIAAFKGDLRDVRATSGEVSDLGVRGDLEGFFG